MDTAVYIVRITVLTPILISPLSVAPYYLHSFIALREAQYWRRQGKSDTTAGKSTPNSRSVMPWYFLPIMCWAKKADPWPWSLSPTDGLCWEVNRWPSHREGPCAMCLFHHLLFSFNWLVLISHPKVICFNSSAMVGWHGVHSYPGTSFSPLSGYKYPPCYCTWHTGYKWRWNPRALKEREPGLP